MRSPLQYRQRALRAAIALPTALMVGFAGLPAAGAQPTSTTGSTSGATSSTAAGTTSVPQTPSEVSQSVAGEQRKIVNDYLKTIKLDEGASVDHVDWISSHRVAVWVKSAAMPQLGPDTPELQQFQILLARDWYKNPEEKFPTLTVLDGLEADPDTPTWITWTNIVDQYADKNVNVILPVGGKASWYSDWKETFDDLNYKWETFIMKEMLPIAEQGFRSTDSRAIVGMSMGATAALNIAENNPKNFKFAGSYSGFLNASSWGAGPLYDYFTILHLKPHFLQQGWGPYGTDGWTEHDPRKRLENLQGTKIYVSAGLGQSDWGQPGSLVNTPVPPPAFATYGEIASRITTRDFELKARAAGVDVTSSYPDSGLHMWPYWQFQLEKSTPDILEALGVPQDGREAKCRPYGAISIAAAAQNVGSCITDEFDVAGNAGRQEDFRGGQIFWKRGDDKAHALYGDILARYDKLNGPAGWLGFPKTGELGTQDGKGRFVEFENGSIYWRLDLKAHQVPIPIRNVWAENGWENGRLGYPTEDPQNTTDGISQKFEHGTITVVKGVGTVTMN